ncbi:replication/maintenance protein RepL [Halogeometricum pallidum]|uniref:replication/maintenance protein RepL n=1 Tax=Halogeometricum pallidum TaxID=411361 RepID=UPI000A02E49E|nr:replication/maintenance protein RepL [Halogeometricum pallidum]
MDDCDNEEETASEKLSQLPNLSGETKPIISGDTPDWFTGADAHILFVMYTGLILTPSVIAENTNVSRVTVSRRLNTLQAGGLVEKVGRGKYQITPDGAFVVTGDPEVYDQAPESNNKNSQ